MLFQELVFLLGLHSRKRSHVSSRQAERTEGDSQLTYQLSNLCTGAPAFQTSKLEFYIKNPIRLFKSLDLSLSKVWALYFVVFGTEVQVSRNNEQRILKMPMPVPWHCFSSAVKVPRNVNAPSSLLANSAAGFKILKLQPTASAEWGEKLRHHHPLHLPFQGRGQH